VVILRGDENLISVKPSPDGTRRHNRELARARPTIAGSGIDSNRVDIGVFAFNGTY